MSVLDWLGGGGDSDARELERNLLGEARSIPLPILKEYYPELYQMVAEMNPEMDSAVNLGPSEMQGIATDPSLRQAQLNALSKLESMGLGEESFEDKSRMANIVSDVNSNLQGQQGAIMQNLAQRGMSGGGTELVARQMASQGAANRMAGMALDSKAQAERRALDAIIQSGQLGGQMQAQDFSQQSAKAQAADSIARFNAANQQGVQSANVGARNQAQMYNVGQKQDTANQNVGARNAANLRNLDISQKEYENRLKKYGLTSGATQNLADSYRNEAERNRQFIGGAIGAGAKYFGGK